MKRKSRAEFRKGVDTVIWGFIEQVVLRVFRKMREDGHKSWRGIQLLGLLLLMVGTSLAFEVIKRETINTCGVTKGGKCIGPACLDHCKDLLFTGRSAWVIVC